MKAHCFFEQSGTFKNEFKKLGFEAYDYDILNDYGETDFQTDLYEEIEKAYEGEPSVFDGIEHEDLIIAFFPCIRFQCKIPLGFRGEMHQQAKWTDVQKLEYAMKLHTELHDLYMRLCKLCLVCIGGGYKLVIENPYTQPHYLTMYFPIKPKLIDKDRSERGDFFRKPTQYFFINLEPKNNLILEPRIIRKMRVVDDCRGAQRSEMSPEYANRFIREFIIEQKERYEDESV